MSKLKCFTADAFLFSDIDAWHSVAATLLSASIESAIENLIDTQDFDFERTKDLSVVPTWNEVDVMLKKIPDSAEMLLLDALDELKHGVVEILRSGEVQCKVCSMSYRPNGTLSEIKVDSGCL